MLAVLTWLLFIDPAMARRHRAHHARPKRPPVAETAAPEAVPAAVPVAVNPVVAAVQAHGDTPVDWYFVLDTSGGMLPIARLLRADLSRWIAGIPDGDRVAVVAMHTRPTEALALTQLDAGNRASVVNLVRTLDLTSANDADLGAGFSWAVHHLTTDGGADRSVLVMMSPFCHSPSVASEFDSGGQGCRPVKGLDKLVDAYAAGHGERLLTTMLYTVAPGKGGVDPVGVAAAQQLFPGATVIDSDTMAMGRWVDDNLANLAVQRALPIARRDAERAALRLTVDATGADTTGAARVRIDGGTTALTLHLTGVTVNGAASDDLDLAPSAVVPVPLDLPPEPFQLWPGQQQIDVPVTVAAAGRLEPADGLTALGIAPDRPGLTATAVAHVVRPVGPTILQAVVSSALGVAVFGGLAALVRARGRKVVLEGAFSYRQVGGNRQPIDVGAVSEAAIGVLPSGGLGLVPPAQAVVILRVVKAPGGAQAEIDIRRDGVEVNARPLERGVHPVRAGAVSVQFDDYRLTWE